MHSPAYTHLLIKIFLCWMNFSKTGSTRVLMLKKKQLITALIDITTGAYLCFMLSVTNAGPPPLWNNKWKLPLAQCLSNFFCHAPPKRRHSLGIIAVAFCHLQQTGYVFSMVCLSVCWFNGLLSRGFWKTCYWSHFNYSGEMYGLDQGFPNFSAHDT